jgi:hypothetical protein
MYIAGRNYDAGALRGLGALPNSMDALGFPGQGGFAFESSKYDAGAIPPNRALDSRGMGCCGLGAAPSGLGLFATPFDLASWGWQEWAIAIGGVFVFYSVFSTTSRAVGTVRRKVRHVAGAGDRARKAKADKLRAEARRLEGDEGGSRRRGRKFLD